MGRLRLAKADLERALRATSERISCLELARICFELKEYEQVRRYAAKAIELDGKLNTTTDPRAFLLLAEALRHLKRYAEAKQAYLRAREAQTKKGEGIDLRIPRGLKLLEEATAQD